MLKVKNVNNNYLNLIGLAYRARKCVIGEEAIVKAIQGRKAKLLVLASDIGKQSKKKITDKCTTYNIPYIIADQREVLSGAIGQTGRVAIAILDKGFSEKIASYFAN